MGYYSEVGLCLNKAAHDRMLAELMQQDKATQAEVQELLMHAQRYVANKGKDEEAILYHWSWIKWYSQFPEVKFIEDFIGNLSDDDDAPEQYRFVSIGEELEDITAHGSYHENPFEMDAGRGVYISPLHKPQENPTK